MFAINSAAVLHIDSVIFIVVLAASAGYFLMRNRRYTLAIEAMEEAMSFAFKERGLEKLLVDVAVLNEQPELDKNSSDRLQVALIANGVKKGYDFFACEFSGEEYELIPWHKHFRSAEFFYVLAGELTVSVEDEIFKLEAGGSLLVPSTKIHSLFLSGKCKFITIAKPSLFSRIGKFYDKSRNKKTKSK